MDKLDIFGLSEKKKLPGERKDLFPGGVPGVTQGIPPEYMKGNQPPPETAQAPTPAPAQAKAAAGEEENAATEPEEKPKPKPKKVAKPKPQPQPAQDTAQQSGVATAAGTARTACTACTAGRPIGMADTGANQHRVTLAFLATTRHLPALTAVGLDPKANRAANT